MNLRAKLAVAVLCATAASSAWAETTRYGISIDQTIAIEKANQAAIAGALMERDCMVSYASPQTCQKLESGKYQCAAVYSTLGDTCRKEILDKQLKEATDKITNACSVNPALCAP